MWLKWYFQLGTKIIIVGVINLVSINIFVTQMHEKNCQFSGKNHLISNLGWDRKRKGVLGLLRENRYSADRTWTHNNYSNTSYHKESSLLLKYSTETTEREHIHFIEKIRINFSDDPTQMESQFLVLSLRITFLSIKKKNMGYGKLIGLDLQGTLK